MPGLIPVRVAEKIGINAVRGSLLEKRREIKKGDIFLLGKPGD